MVILFITFSCIAQSEPTDVSKNSSISSISGAKLVQKFQCDRCHTESPYWKKPDISSSCHGCHQAIFDGFFDDEYEPDGVAQWKSNIRSFHHVPSLHGVSRFQREWFVSYLTKPFDIRPNMHGMMPRMDISKEDAVDIANYFSMKQSAPPQTDVGNYDRGVTIIQNKGCMSCHHFSNHDLKYTGPSIATTIQELAPDLRHSVDRLSGTNLRQWLKNPLSLKKDAQMPNLQLSDQEIEDVIAVLVSQKDSSLLYTDLELLPLLDRPIGYAEVEEKIFHKVCWHCHSYPSKANRGDAGPGNTGGFGFDGVGLNLGTYEGIMNGKNGKSIVSSKDGKEPLLLRVLYHRYLEMNGEQKDIKGMPLGLPPLDAKQIQLLRSWIAQGAPNEVQY